MSDALQQFLDQEGLGAEEQEEPRRAAGVEETKEGRDLQLRTLRRRS